MLRFFISALKSSLIKKNNFVLQKMKICSKLLFVNWTVFCKVSIYNYKGIWIRRPWSSLDFGAQIFIRLAYLIGNISAATINIEAIVWSMWFTNIVASCCKMYFCSELANHPCPTWKANTGLADRKSEVRSNALFKQVIWSCPCCYQYYLSCSINIKF